MRSACTAPKAFSMPRISTIGVGSGRVRHGRSPCSCASREAGSQAAEDVGLAHPDVDQHRDDQDHADEDVDPVLRHGEALDVELQQRADQRDHGGAGERADHRAVAAEDRAAADDHRGDGVELAELAGDRVEAAEIGDVDDPGHGRAERRQHERDEAHPVGVDAGIGGGADVAAGGVDLLAERRVGEHDAGDRARRASIQIVWTLTTSATARSRPVRQRDAEVQRGCRSPCGRAGCSPRASR